MSSNLQRTEPQPQRAADRLKACLAVGVIAAAVVAAYHRTFLVPFLFDDQFTIQGNPSIRSLRSLGSVLFPPHYAFSAGRPFLNLTFALNYAMGRLSVQGYHVINLLIHILAGVTLFAIARITLSLPRFREKYGGAAPILALAIALLWVLHPIQTESVTYISQRAESLMGLFYLLTLYFFIRAATSSVPGPWAALSVAACLFGMMTKEVMVTAPLIVLLYDRAFVAGTFREAWRRQGRIYLGLAATWLVLAGLMLSSNLTHRDVGYSAGLDGWTYALTESRVVIEYLKLTLWPHPLIFDYGPVLIQRFAEAAPYLLILVLLLALTLLALRRWPSLGFLGAWLFVILAPTSSFVPVAGQPMAENRLYLPLAAIVTLGVIGLYACIGRKGFCVACTAVAIALGIFTVRRNSDYRNAVAIWSDTILRQPENARAHNNLGSAFAEIPGRSSDAIAQYEIAMKLKPDYAKAYENKGNVLAKIPGRLPEAIALYEAALKIRPNYVEIHFILGNAWLKIPGHLPDAITHFEAALKIKPDFAEAHYNLGDALANTPGRLPEAIGHYEAAARIRPDFAEAHFNLANALTNVPGRLPEAITHFEAALKIEPDVADIHNNFGIALAKTPGRLGDAIAQFETAVKLKPDYAEARFNLGSALLAMGDRTQEAWAQFDTVLRLRPDMAPQIAALRSASH